MSKLKMQDKITDDDMRSYQTISDELFYSESNINELTRRINDVKSGKSKLVHHDLIEVD